MNSGGALAPLALFAPPMYVLVNSQAMQDLAALLCFIT